MRIGIVGHFGGEQQFTDGQTVKVLSLYKGLEKHCTGVTIDKIDTYYLKANKIRFFVSFLKCLLFDKKIIFLPAFRSRKLLFGLFYYIKLFLRKEVYHDCIAGSLDKEIAEHSNWLKYLNAFEANWMESPEQVEILRKIGVLNAEYLPNFKNIEPLSENDLLSFKVSYPLRFCTFSRVEERKGIEDALKAIQEINEIKGNVATLDVYGPVQPGHENWFSKIKEQYSDVLNYCGIVSPNDSVSILKDYFALLFPTQYFTEGMPGTIIDAMYAGVPVIARKWKWCDNMIQSGYNGISYDFEHPEKLKDILLDIISNQDIILEMKKNCLRESDKYSETKIVNSIKMKMGL